MDTSFSASMSAIGFWGQGALLGPEGLSAALIVDRRVIPENVGGFSVVLDRFADALARSSAHPVAVDVFRDKAVLFGFLERGEYRGDVASIGRSDATTLSDMLRQMPPEVVSEAADSVRSGYALSEGKRVLRKLSALRNPSVWQFLDVHLKNGGAAFRLDPILQARHLEGIADWYLTFGNEEKAKKPYALAARMWVLSAWRFLSRRAGLELGMGARLIHTSILEDLHRGIDGYRRAGKWKEEKSLTRLSEYFARDGSAATGQRALLWKEKLYHWLKTEA